MSAVAKNARLFVTLFACTMCYLIVCQSAPKPDGSQQTRGNWRAFISEPLAPGNGSAHPKTNDFAGFISS